MSFCPSALRGVSVLTELTLGHLRYAFADVPPQPNSLASHVLGGDAGAETPVVLMKLTTTSVSNHAVGTVPKARTPDGQNHAARSRASQRPSEWSGDDGQGVSLSMPTPKDQHLPCTLHPTRHSTRPNWSEALKGLLAPLIMHRPFPMLRVRQDPGRDSGNLVNPFMRVTN